jgi:antitoxin VapB
MAEIYTARLLTYRGGQAVKLPRALRFPGKSVRIRRFGRGVLIEPIAPKPVDIREVFARLDRYLDTPFMEDGRQQPPMPPPDDVSFDD